MAGTPSFLTSSWDDLEKFFGVGGKTTANTMGMTPQQARVATGAATISNAGTLISLFGAANSSVAGYFAAETAKYQQESEASTLNFQANMDTINAASAEMNAQSIQEYGKTQVAQYTMRAGQEMASEQVGAAARGIALDSASEVTQRASDQLVKDIDVMQINANTTRAAWAQRTQATNDSNDALLKRTGAANLTASSKSISPGLAVTTSLLNSGTQIASQWDYRRKLANATATAPQAQPVSIGGW